MHMQNVEHMTYIKRTVSKTYLEPQPPFRRSFFYCSQNVESFCCRVEKRYSSGMACLLIESRSSLNFQIEPIWLSRLFCNQCWKIWR